MFTPHAWHAYVLFSLDFLLRLFFCLRILRRRLPVGVAWAWLGLVLLFPFGGTFLYLLLGEYRMGSRRERRLKAAMETIERINQQRLQRHAQDESRLHESAVTVARSARGLFQAPLIAGNEIELLPGADAAFPVMIADIDRAQQSCSMEFYIWSDGGRADEFGEALIRAAKRGVVVRVLVDQVGSSAFLKGSMVKKLRASGVQVVAALPSGLVRALFARPDLRIHRKILVIDETIAFTGSLNLADPKFFHIDAGVGQWVDALCRIRGPAVEALSLVFWSDWCVETKTELPDVAHDPSRLHKAHLATIQCLASGPAIKQSNIEQLLITSIYSAKKELTLTTPYFVPSESMLYALTAAARRGVNVTLIVPAKVDSKLTQYASQAFLKDLIQAGVRVALFTGGLLHTKSVTLDGEYCLFGSLNLDPRSLRINFEITAAIYDREFTGALVELQTRYLNQSRILTVADCEAQGAIRRLREDLARLVGPLL